MAINESDVYRFGDAAKKQIMEKMSAAGKPAKNRKYHNEPCGVDGIRFDSQKEARRYRELMLLQDAGLIENLKLQPQFTLQEGYRLPSGERVKAIRYVADFSYVDKRTDKLVVEDVKSPATRTRVYELKKKLMLEKYATEIEEV